MVIGDRDTYGRRDTPLFVGGGWGVSGWEIARGCLKDKEVWILWEFPGNSDLPRRVRRRGVRMAHRPAIEEFLISPQHDN